MAVAPKPQRQWPPRHRHSKALLDRKDRRATLDSRARQGKPVIKVRQDAKATEDEKDEMANPVIKAGQENKATKAGQDAKANPGRPVSRVRPRHVPQDSIATPTTMAQ